ncbi:MAG: riboflavin biosynthesis protein RibF [Candidatus Aminicenantes bacterium]|nr:riboflavin biosynthesis protein RibF [Candidatus Aminicenantes bacterium]
MIVYRGLDDVRLRPCPAAVAVGNFDGLHLGHRKILSKLCGLAEKRGLRSLVLTFDPHPERALGKKSVRMIDTPDKRLERFGDTCVDAVVVTSFDTSFSRLSCPDFVDRILADKLDAREVVVGRDFRFGRNRRGDTARLRVLGRRIGLAVHVVPPAVLDGRVVSSSAIRRLLGRGRVGEAARLLGRPYEISGHVVRGRHRGSLLGFPTANLATASELLPEGVFISETVRRGRIFRSLTSIGTNPTFGPHPLSVETLLLDYRGSLYGAELTVRLLRRLRPLKKFPDSAALGAGIGRDVEAARAYFLARG